MSPENFNLILRWCPMLSYHTLKDKPCVLRAFTSLDREEFETLLIPFQQAWEAYVTIPNAKPPAMLEESQCFTYAEDLPECFDRSKHHTGDLP